MLFKDVIGLQETKRHLLDLVSNNRLSHALLFVGKEGSGALPLAMTFANFLILQPSTSTSQSLFDAVPTPIPNFSESEDADQWMVKQAGFSKAKDLVHPDIHFTYPVITKKPGTPPISTDYISEWREFISKYPYGNVYDWLQFIGAENKQGNITSNECNDIIRKLNLKSFESEYKLQIVWMPEYLGNEGNKLLKMIEEPPPNTLFLLVTENESLNPFSHRRTYLIPQRLRTNIGLNDEMLLYDMCHSLLSQNMIEPDSQGMEKHFCICIPFNVVSSAVQFFNYRLLL